MKFFIQFTFTTILFGLLMVVAVRYFNPALTFFSGWIAAITAVVVNKSIGYVYERRKELSARNEWIKHYK